MSDKNFTLTTRQLDDALHAYGHACSDAVAAACDEYICKNTRSLVRGVKVLDKLIQAHRPKKKERGE